MAVYMAACGPCTQLRKWSVNDRVHGSRTHRYTYTAVYKCTRPEHVLVHGRVQERWPYPRPCTDRVDSHEHWRVLMRIAYAYTYTVMYTCTRPKHNRVHGRVHGPCTRAHDRLHGCVWAVCMAVYPGLYTGRTCTAKATLW